MKKSELRQIIKEEIQDMLKERITHGAEVQYNLKDEPITLFAKEYKGQKKDIFFTTDNKAIITDRGSNLIYHGKEAGKSLNLKQVKFVYCGLEDKFYKARDFGTLLSSIHDGRKSKVKSIEPPKVW